MDILPALDIANGRALTHRGADGREGSTSADPFEVARSFVAQGASWIHLVDIDAAFERGNNSDVLSEVISDLHGSEASISGRLAPECRIEWSGGVRSGEDIEAALQAGADRVNLASQTLVDIDRVRTLIAEFAGRLNICMGTRVAFGKSAAFWTKRVCSATSSPSGNETGHLWDRP